MDYERGNPHSEEWPICDKDGCTEKCKMGPCGQANKYCYEHVTGFTN